MVSERFQGANVVNAGVLSPYWGEHAARYVFALPLVSGKRVLDIACGTGYGLGLLSGSAKYVTGVDVDMEAATQARAECKGLSAVVLGNGLTLPFADESFDVITSFETLEHLRERSRFLSELKRVLSRDGVLILSTPNANYTKPVNGVPHNPFHVFEYSPDELRDELESHFSVKKFLGQSLDGSIKIPPFQDAQKQLPKDLGTQSMLFGWKVFNKIPLGLREKISNAVWKKPFYPIESDYRFTADSVETAPVLVAVCSK
jgi:SAM-dependent methyltransferase